jgi:hypothetical protein
LVLADPKKGTARSSLLGMYTLDEGYDQAVIFKDGPIFYGAGLIGNDRNVAWKNLSMLMMETAARQQGMPALEGMLLRRCMPGEDYCTAMITANLIGIGGIKEPRRVDLILATDVRDEKNHKARMVCTWPTDLMKVYRDWGSGQLQSLQMKDKVGDWHTTK